MNASFRFLIVAAAIVLWLGAVATAREPAARGGWSLPGLATAPASDGEAEPARAAGGEAPVEDPEANSGE